jgi:PDDEXK-like uncharacterized protein DUF3799
LIANIVRNMPKADYQAIRALNASGAHTIERSCPAAYWHTSPFNPDAAEEEDANHFDIGEATHLLLLEPDKFDDAVAVIEAPNYTTKAAREARERARNAGLTPLLAKEVDIVEAMARAILADPVASGFRGGGDTEVTMTWTDPDFGFPCKLRVDHLPHNLVDLRDVKSAANANPRDFERGAWTHGYPQRAAWYLDGVELVTGQRPRFYWFIAVEKKPPFLVSVMKYPDEDVEWGRVLNMRARAMFAECLEKGEWPGYRPAGAQRPRAFEIRLPGWALHELQGLADTGVIKMPRSTAELERQQLRYRLAARLAAPTMDRDYMP